MSSQEIFDKKKIAAWNFRIIRQFRLKTQDDVVKDTGISKQNVSAWENLKGNPGQDFVDQLAAYFDLPKELFFKDGLTKEYLEKNFSGKNHTPAINSTGSNHSDLVSNVAAFKEMMELYTDYTLIPKTLLENHRLISKEQMDRDERTLNKLLDWIEKQQEEIGTLRTQVAVVKKG